MKKRAMSLLLGISAQLFAGALPSGIYQYNYYTPALYGNALSGFFGDCFPVGGASVPLYSRLYAPPSWSSAVGSATYNLDQIFGKNSWINSGLTEFKSKKNQLEKGSDKDLIPSNFSKYPFLLKGGAEWGVNAPNLVSYIQNNEGTQPFNYYNAALLEYFSARLAMAASAFTAPAAGGNTTSGFLNMLYPNSAQYTYSEQAILNNFVTAAQNLFSWARYLRNITVPDSMNLPSVASMNGQSPVTMTQANGYTLGGLDTFVGAIVISPESAPTTAPATPASTDANGNPVPAQVGASVAAENYGMQQVVYPSFQKPAEPSQVPSAGGGNGQGLLTNMATPITVSVPTQNLRDRFQFPGYSSFMTRIPNNSNLYFFPVASQVYNISTNGTPNYYAVQEPADNWATASTSTCNSVATCNPGSVYFRQVAFRPSINGGLSGGAVIVGVGVTSAPNGTAAVPAVTTITVGQVAAYDQNSASAPAAGYPVQLDTQAGFTVANFNYSDPSFSNFFADRQPWAVVIQMVPTFVSPTGTTNGQPNPVVPGFPNGFYQLNPTVVGVVKLNSFDFPLTFAQDPLAQGYSAYQSTQNTKQGTLGMASVTPPTSSSAGVWVGSLPDVSNPLLPSLGQSGVTVGNGVGIAFSQRDVWEGVEDLYALAVQKITYPPYPTYNYSFAYLFLQGLFNGHLYSSTANSLYSVMQQNKTIKGRKQSAVKEQGIIGSVTYDYISETELPLYSITNNLPLTQNSTPAYGVWPVNEFRKEPTSVDWLNPGTPLDWVFLRALIVGRALMENVGVTIEALPYLETILSNPTASFSVTRRGYVPASKNSPELPSYIGQTSNYQTVLTVLPTTASTSN